MQLSCRFDSLPAPHHTTLMINFPAMMRNVDGINRKLQFIDKINRAATLMVGKRAEDKKLRHQMCVFSELSSLCSDLK